MDSPIYTNYIQSGGATPLIFVVDGANAVSPFVIRSMITCTMDVPPDSTTWRTGL